MLQGIPDDHPMQEEGAPVPAAGNPPAAATGTPASTGGSAGGGTAQGPLSALASSHASVPGKLSPLFVTPTPCLPLLYSEIHSAQALSGRYLFELLSLL